jgi:outer membrane protein TolC
LSKNSLEKLIFWQWLVFAVLVLVVGCEASRYGKVADDEVYGILDSRRQAVLGKTNQFRIDTDISKRSPEDINGSEIVRDRYLGSSGQFWEKTGTGVQQKLTLEKALELAEQANRTYQSNREKLYLAALSLTGTRHQFALKFTKSSVDLGIERKSNGKLRGNSDADLTLQKMLKTGGTISATLANDLVLYFDGKPKVPSITLSLAQPLLRGAGADIAAEILTQAERNVIYEVRDFNHYQKDFAVEIVNDYFSLLQQGESMRLSYNNYTNRIFFRKEIEARVAAGLQSEFEAKQALESEYNQKLSYISSTNSYQNSLDDFKQKLSLPLGERLALDFSELVKLKEQAIINQETGKKELPVVPLTDRLGYRLAITNRLDIMNEVDRFEDSKRKVKVSRNDLLPSLSIVADAALKDQFYSSFQPEDFTANAGLKLDLPLDQLSERNKYRQSLINFERQLRTLAIRLDSLRDGVRTDVRNLTRQKENYFTQREALKNADESLLATRQRLRLGFPGVRTRDIITAQDALERAQQSVLSAIVDYQKTRLKLLKDVGILDTSVKGFWLENQSVPGVKAMLQNPADGSSIQLIPPQEILRN